jgi:cellobiose-specific phosphotransferase system component IIA
MKNNIISRFFASPKAKNAKQMRMPCLPPSKMQKQCKHFKKLQKQIETNTKNIQKLMQTNAKQCKQIQRKCNQTQKQYELFLVHAQISVKS